MEEKNVWKVERFSQRKIQGINESLFIFFNTFANWRTGRKFLILFLKTLHYHKRVLYCIVFFLLKLIFFFKEGKHNV